MTAARSMKVHRWTNLQTELKTLLKGGTKRFQLFEERVSDAEETGELWRDVEDTRCWVLVLHLPHLSMVRSLPSQRDSNAAWIHGY